MSQTIQQRVNQSFISVCKSGVLANVQKMLEDSPKPDVNYLHAHGYRLAVKNQHLRVVKALLPMIDLEYQCMAFEAACQHNLLQSYQTIIDNSNILQQLTQTDWARILKNHVIKSSRYVPIFELKLGVDTYRGREMVKALSRIEVEELLQSYEQKKNLESSIGLPEAKKFLKL